MSRLPDDFYQDRALRDAARDVLVADIEHARASLSGKAIAGRVAGRVGDGAKDVLEVAKGHADDKRGILAIIIAFIALWFAREPIAEIFSEVFSELDETLEDETETPDNDTQDKPDDESALDLDDGTGDQGGAGHEPEATIETERVAEPLTTGDTP